MVQQTTEAQGFSAKLVAVLLKKLSSKTRVSSSIIFKIPKKTTFGLPSEEAVAKGIGYCFSRVSITSGGIFTISSPPAKQIPILFIP